MATEITTKPTPPDQLPPAEVEEEELAQMGFWDHINELRDRLVKIMLAVGLGMLVSAFFTNQVLEVMIQSYGEPLRTTSPTESVTVFFKVVLMLGAILASPLITYQIFMFVMPGLTQRERRWVFLALPGTTGLFIIGLLFTWVFLIPAYVGFLRDFQSNVFQALWTADSYIGFLTAVLFYHAAAFEAPLVFYVLARGGFVTAGQMITYWRQAVIGAAIVAAVITPTIDPVTMLMITGVLLGLYILSIFLVAFAQRRSPLHQPIA
ncbi:MAG: twin-arginine translocase subunit TatC [Anaerolineae bacterium]